MNNQHHDLFYFSLSPVHHYKQNITCFKVKHKTVR